MCRHLNVHLCIAYFALTTPRSCIFQCLSPIPAFNFTWQDKWLAITNSEYSSLLFRTKWLPVNISVNDGVLVIKRSTPPSMPISSSTVVPPDTPPLHEFRLHHNHMVTPPQLRPYDRKTKLHQIKLRQTRVINCVLFMFLARLPCKKRRAD